MQGPENGVRLCLALKSASLATPLPNIPVSIKMESENQDTQRRPGSTKGAETAHGSRVQKVEGMGLDWIRDSTSGPAFVEAEVTSLEKGVTCPLS